MSDTTIHNTLRRVRGRLTAAKALETGLRWMFWGTVAAAVGAALTALAFSFLPAWYPYPWGVLPVIPLAFLIGCALRLARPYSLREAAVYLDRQAGLHERVATAWELASQGDESKLGRLVRQEAEEVCRQFRPGTISYTAKLQETARYLAVALVACGAVLFIPPLRTSGYLEHQAEMAQAAAAKEQLTRFRRELAAQGSADDARLRQMTAKLDEAIRELEAADPETAAAALKRLSEELAKQRAIAEAEKELAEAAREARQNQSVAQAMSKGQSGDAARQALADKMARGQLSAQEKQAMERMARAASETATAAGDSSLGQSAESVSQSCESGQGDAATLASDLKKIGEAADRATANQANSAERDRQLADAAGAVEAARSKVSSGSPGAERTASADATPTTSRRPDESPSEAGLEQVPLERRYVQIYEARTPTAGQGSEATSPDLSAANGQVNPAERTQVVSAGDFTAERARLAEEALAQNPLPAELQNMVRRYFTPDGR
jgi:hypothetical protein